MAIFLKKGQKIDLRKDNGDSLKSITVGLGWDVIEQPKKGGFLSIFAPKAPDVDCDASVIVCQNGKFCTTSDLVYFGHLNHQSGAIRHMGDNLTGAGDGDDEQIRVQLSKVPEMYDKLIFVVNIYAAVSRKQHFGMVQNAFIRVVDNDTNQEMCRFNLSENYDNMTAMIFGEVYHQDGKWKFNAIGQGTTDSSLESLANRFK